MKKNPNNSVFPFVVSAALLVGLVACKPGGGSSSSGEVFRAFPDEADVAMYFDQAAMSKSGFSQALEEMQEEMPQAEMASVLADQITEMTGLDEDDITAIALSLSNIDSFQTDPSAVRISGAVSVSEPVTAEQIAEAIELAASENGEEVDVTVVPGDGVDYLEFPVEEGMPLIVAAIVTGSSDTLAFFGDRPSVEASLARTSGSVPAALSAPSEGLIDGQQGWISFKLTDLLKAQLAGVGAQWSQMAPGLEKIESLQSVGMGMKATETLDIAIGFNLGSAADAQAITGVLNNQLISFARMMVAGNTPEPIPALDTLSASANGDRATLSVVISLTDLEIIREQMGGFMTQGMGGM